MSPRERAKRALAVDFWGMHDSGNAMKLAERAMAAMQRLTLTDPEAAEAVLRPFNSKAP